MAKSFRCRVVTPAASLLDEQVKYASVPAWDGLFGVLPGRAPIVARLGAGELRINFADSAQGTGGERSYFIDGGFVQMASDQLTILAELAIPAESLNVAEAEAELRAAESAKPTPGVPLGAEMQRLNSLKERGRAKVRLARERKAI